MSNDDNIIRGDAQHQVTMSDNSNVAVRKTGDPTGASVRKVLAEEEPEPTVQDASVAVHRELAPDAPAVSGVNRALVPEGAASASAHRALVPEGAAKNTAPDNALVPPPLTAQGARVSVPDALAKAQGAADVPAGTVTDKHGLDIPASAGSERPTLDIPVGEVSARPTLEIPSSAPTGPKPIEAADVKALLDDLKVPAEGVLEEQLGAPDAAWVEMDYPARVVKLKIANDKVRRTLDVLERDA